MPYKFYYTEVAVKGKMPDGSWRTFSTELEYKEAYDEERKDDATR